MVDVGAGALCLARLGDAEAVAFARDVESLARVLSSLQVTIAAELTARAAAGRYEAAGRPSPSAARSACGGSP
ncbi:hypothetical protein [Specibacter cremeus]|uniref:hypothetical protein n=1 Tax=Specibacter cremeus TaxID=1629051 RepID=UPI000F784A99|nr:hypothetical protein [Specibacter cremeus]